ncbi:MAG: type IV pilin N-terminal domain-containing protein [Methanocorpusculum sp.]|nr:type IV pilin N-terminal domain-containing protein [Methanocorpusculum sp.]
MIQKKSDDAVSPVIGVMLMLVITIVIAAVITMFATGLVTDTEPAPVAVLDVEILSAVDVLGDAMYDSFAGPDFRITHISGDPIDTANIEIRLSWTDQNGKYWYSTYSADKFSENPGSVTGDGGTRSQPMYVKMKTTGSSGLDHYFGDVILTPGLKLTATTDYLNRDAEINVGSQFMDAIFCSSGEVKTIDSETDPGIMKYLPQGTAVNVMILHTPSDKAIYDKVVYVK